MGANYSGGHFEPGLAGGWRGDCRGRFRLPRIGVPHGGFSSVSRYAYGSGDCNGFATTYVLLNLLADILSIIANPRLRHRK